mgnify:CR=1 FL=1
MKSRALKEEAMPMMKETSMQEMMNEANDMMTSGRNSMMRANVMMTGAKMIMGKKKQKSNKPDLSEFDETYHWSKAKKEKK